MLIAHLVVAISSERDQPMPPVILVYRLARSFEPLLARFLKPIGLAAVCIPHKVYLR